MLQLNRRGTTEQVQLVKEVKVHAGFNSQTYENDIALLLLDDPFIFDEYVSSAALWNGSLPGKD